MKIILDTNFILTCIKNKIDFLEAEDFGILVIPEQVLAELKKLRERDKSKNSKNAELAVKIISKNKDKLKTICLDRKFVDAGIKNYVNNNRNVIIASLDKSLKKELKNKAKFLVIKNMKRLEVV